MPAARMLLLPLLSLSTSFLAATALPSPGVAVKYQPTEQSISYMKNPHAHRQSNFVKSSFPAPSKYDTGTGTEYPPKMPKEPHDYHKPGTEYPPQPSHDYHKPGGAGDGDPKPDYPHPHQSPHYVQSYAYGCYTEPEDHKDRALTGPSYVNYTSMTIDECEYFCTGSGYRLWGVEYSGECYCGNHLSHGSFPTFPDDCDLPCPGDSQEYCGGSNRLSLYGTEAQPPKVYASSHPAVYGYNYLGCWTEGDGVRALSGASVASEQFMTVERCGNYCIDTGFTVFGVEYGSECYCGHELARSSYVAYQKECDMECSGKEGEVCGGRERLSLYHWV